MELEITTADYERKVLQHDIDVAVNFVLILMTVIMKGKKIDDRYKN